MLFNILLGEKKTHKIVKTNKMNVIACGIAHTVVLLSDNTVQCLGNNSWKQCDLLCSTFTNVIRVACGAYHSVALLSDNTVQCWGNNDNKQCDPLHQNLRDVVQVVCGYYHSVALLSDGTVKC